jgi:hypothetical protein
MVVKPAEDDTRAKCTQVIINNWRGDGAQSYHCRIGSAIALGRKLLPPSCIAEPPSVHLSHVAHANDPDHEAIGAFVECLRRHRLEMIEKWSNE